MASAEYGTLVSALTSGQVLQTLLVALLVGFALQGMGPSGEPVLRAIGHFQRLIFRVLSLVMWTAPIGAFGAMAAVVGATGIEALKMYQARMDDRRGLSLGPRHDWTSHAADALRYLMAAYEEPAMARPRNSTHNAPPTPSIT